MSKEKITTMEQGEQLIKELLAKLKNTKDTVTRKTIKMDILTVRQKMMSLEKKKLADEKKAAERKIKLMNSATARKCRNHGLICVALGVLYREHKIDDFNKICSAGNSAVEEFAKTQFGYKKGETK